MNSESQIFNKARKLPDQQRDNYLDDACGNDAVLRKRVEALLRADKTVELPSEYRNSEADADDANATQLPAAKKTDDSLHLNSQSFVLEPVETFDSSHAGIRDASSEGLVAGDRIGPYRLIEQIGEGGMGTVWKAQQSEPVQRIVALKYVKAGLFGKQIVARFEAERQAIAMMSHENIAKVFDAGTTDDGSPYFVMELIEGLPITDYCDQHKLSPDQRLKLFVPVCNAIQHAHQKAIIHRDLKPSNILVSVNDGKAVAKVIDFGLAKALEQDQRLTDKTYFTEVGLVMGTLQYMSPEQAGLNDLDIDTRTDVYSLGVVLYELLTGSTPIEQETFKRAAREKMMEIVRELEPPRPSNRLSSSVKKLDAISELRQTQPGRLKKILRGDLDWIVMKALEKDRARRYESATGFADDLGRYLGGETVEARPPSISYQLQKFVRRNRGLVASLATALLLVLAGLAGTTWGLNWALRERASAIASEERANVARDKAERAAYYGAIQTSDVDIKLDDFHRLRATLEDQPPEYRGWEWGYLATATRPPDFLDGNDSKGGGVAVSPDGKTLLFVSSGKASLYALPDRKLIWETEVRDTFYTPQPVFVDGGRWIALLLEKDAFAVLDARTGKVVQKIENLDARSLEAHPTEPWLYVGNGEGELVVVDTGDWQVLRRQATGLGFVRCIAVSSDGKLVAFFCGSRGTENQKFFLLDARTLKVIHTFRCQASEGVYDLAIVEQADALIATEGSNARVLSLVTGKQIASLDGDGQNVFKTVVSRNRKQIAVGGMTGTVKVFDVDQIKPSEDLLKPVSTRFADGQVVEMVGLPAGGLAVTAANRPLQTWSGTTNHALRSPVVIEQKSRAGTYQVEYRDDGGIVIASGWWVDDAILVYDPVSQIKRMVQLPGMSKVDKYFKWVHFRPGTHEIAAHTPDCLRFFDSSGGVEKADWPLLREIQLSGPLNYFTFSPSGERVAIAYQGGAVDVVDVATGERTASLAIQDDSSALFVKFSADGALIALHEKYDSGESLVVCDATSGEVLHRLPTTFSFHNTFGYAFHPTADLLAVGERDGRIIIYDTLSGDAVKTLFLEGSNDVNSLQFSKDGNRLLSGSVARNLQLWDWQLGKSLYSIPFGWYCLSARFSPDGRSIAANTLSGMKIFEADAFSPTDDADPPQISGDVTTDLLLQKASHQLLTGDRKAAWNGLMQAEENIGKLEMQPVSSTRLHSSLTARMEAVANACEEDEDWELAETIWRKVAQRRKADESDVLYRAAVVSLANACKQQSKSCPKGIGEDSEVDLDRLTLRIKNFSRSQHEVDMKSHGFILTDMDVSGNEENRVTNATFAKNRPVKYASTSGHIKDGEFEDYQAFYRESDFRMVQHSTYTKAGQRWHVVVWLQATGEEDKRLIKIEQALLKSESVQ